VKVWNTTSGFCFVTFSEHSAAVSAVESTKQGQVLFTASVDGTFSCLTVDPSGEVVAAGSTDSFEVFLWSVQTGKLLDILTGHEGPISWLAFSPSGNLLASGSWDKSVRVWTVFESSRAVEPFQLSADVLAVAFRPDGKELAASSLDGQVMFFDVNLGQQTNLIDGRRDISGGRKADDRVTAANGTSGKSFNSLAYTADGQCIIAGGNSKYAVIYDKFQISQNLSLDGTEEFLDSRKLTEADNIESDLEDRMDTALPGAQHGDMSKRQYRQESRTK
ncbi:WD40-repeat-containing domain protein, partial [Dichomitus squalens]